MIFTHARLILPDGVRDGFELVERAGKICAIRESSRSMSDETIDLEGNYLAPGFIDLHIHGAVGRDTMEATPDAFRAIAEYHASGGTTSLLLTTATAPIEEIINVLACVRELRPQIPQIAGVHIEGPFISRVRSGAQNPKFICDPAPEMVTRLLEYSDVIRRLTLAPELPGALAVVSRLRAENIAVSGGHSDAWDEDARGAFEQGMRHVTHTFNCMSSARRRGPQRVAGLLEVALSEPEILCELIADGHHVAPTLMKMLCRAKGAAGVCLVTDATAGAGLPSNSRFMLGGIDCVVADGACWLADRSALAGSAARMIDLVRVMVKKVGISLAEAIKMASANPARALENESKGSLEIGYDADLVVLSPELAVKRTFVTGRQLFPPLEPAN